MDIEEFSTEFDTYVNSYATKVIHGDEAPRDTFSFDEYEKSVYLTEAQEEIVTSLYNGKNPYGEVFEGTEEMRRYLDSLVKPKIYNEEDQVDYIGVSDKSVFYKLPPDLGYIVLEQIVFNDDSLKCYNGSTANVYPITHDEWSKIRRNPFRGPSKYKAVRLDCGDNIVELISEYHIQKYLLKYIARLSPIILVDLPEGLSIRGERIAMGCKLNPILHSTILRRAVELALQSKGIVAKA